MVVLLDHDGDLRNPSRKDPHLVNRRTRLLAGAAALAALGGAGLTAAQAAPFGFANDRSAELAGQINPAKPRNVILIIGDGTDDSIITAARNYELGAAGRFALDELPFTGEMTTYGLKTAPDGSRYPINYVSDSAPTASGWSTGKKTVDGRISQGPSSADTVAGVDYDTVLEIYKRQGKRTGNVSTAEITDATPAAAASHINARACQGPANMATCPSALKAVGGKGSIAEQLVDTKVDVLLGGGAQRYAQTLPGGGTVLDYAKATRGYQSVSDRAGLAAVSSVATSPVIGLFATGNMTPRYQPLPVASPAGAGDANTTCQLANRGTQPTLSEMTDKAISLLDNPNGFFLQVESAMIDKQEHAADVCGAIGDVAEMDDTLKVAQAYQKTHPDTLIIVTGDHAHSTQIVPNSTSAGRATTTIRTKDGDPMTVAYSTADTTAAGGFSMTHTGAQIRVAASGPQAANVTGTIDQTDLFATLLGRTPSTMPTTTNPAPAVKPVAAVAAQPRVSRVQLRRGVVVDVAASGATTVTVTVTGKRVLETTTVSAAGGSVKVKLSAKQLKKVKRSVTVTVTATGAGGTTSSSTRIRTTR